MPNDEENNPKIPSNEPAPEPKPERPVFPEDRIEKGEKPPQDGSWVTKKM